MRLAIAALAALSAFAPAAWAEGPKVLVLGEPKQPLVVQLEDELRAAGLSIESKPIGERTDLAAIGREHGVRAVVRVAGDSRQIVIVAEPQSSEAGAPQSEYVITAPENAVSDPNLMALRAVEMVRGLLLPVAARAPAAAPSSKPRPEETSQSARPAARREEDQRGFSLLLAPGALVSPSGPLLAMDIRVGAEARFAGWLGVDASLWMPAGSAAADAPGGDLSVRLSLASLGLRASTTAAEHWSIGASAGAAALWVQWDREAVGQRAAVEDESVSFLPYAGASGAYWLHPVAGLRADILGGWSIPTVELDAPFSPPGMGAAAQRRDNPTVGDPLLMFSLGLEVRL